MAAHRWRTLLHGDARDLIGEPRRKCENCGATQHLEKDYWWGRVASRKWRPKVGRCPRKDADAKSSS